MLNYLKKFAMEIVPSVAATIIGAYIVNHYINAKPAPETPPAAAVSTAQPKSDAAKAEAGKSEAGKSEAGKSEAGKSEAAKAEAAKPDAAKSGPEAEVAGIPASGVKAKGISEKAILEKNAAAEKAVVVEKPAEKAADKPAETTASIPAETKRPAAPRVAKTAPAPVQPVIAAAPADASAVVEERRDANDLARAAIERLRAGSESGKRAPEAARVPEAPRVVTAPPSAVTALPPPIVVAAPPEATEPRAPYNAATRGEDPLRPTPPAEIPTVRPPLDLRAEVAAEPPPPKQKTNVAEEVLSAAKSMFHAVLPKKTDLN
jgi:hypothetical protein